MGGGGNVCLYVDAYLCIILLVDAWKGVVQVFICRLFFLVYLYVNIEEMNRSFRSVRDFLLLCLCTTFLFSPFPLPLSPSPPSPSPRARALSLSPPTTRTVSPPSNWTPPPPARAVDRLRHVGKVPGGNADEGARGHGVHHGSGGASGGIHQAG